MYYHTANPVLLAAAVIPAAVLMICVYRMDRLEKEPWPMLFLLGLQGVVSTSLAVFAERLGTRLLSGMLPEDTILYQIVFNMIVVGLSEEGFKYLLLKRRTWHSPQFNCLFDGVVYAVFVSLGFALWENIDYVIMYGLQAAMIRAVTAVPGHACFGVFMGAWYGLARRWENRGDHAQSRLCLRLAVAVPALLHGLYDLIATLKGGLSWLFAGFILIMFGLALRTAGRLSGTDSYI